MNYYNELDPYAAQWIRNLIAKSLIPDGKVDERDIRKVKAKEIKSYTQAHFFAGIAGWSYALQLAGWPEDEEVWTGSCPCQPFSIAGKGKGTKDKRHLWPVWRELIAECRPTVCFGEQVGSPLGRDWLAGVRSDLEALGYEVGCADLCAAGVGAPHIRQRLFWVADAECPERRPPTERREHVTNGQNTRRQEEAGGCGICCAVNSRLADAERDAGKSRRLAIESRKSVGAAQARPYAESGRCSGTGGLGNTGGKGSRRNTRAVLGTETTRKGARKETGGKPDQSVSPGFWSRFELVQCADGKARRVKPGAFPLAFKLPRSVGQSKSRLEAMGLLAKAAETLTGAKRNQIGRLKGYGNAIVPILAAEFIMAYLETRRATHV